MKVLMISPSISGIDSEPEIDLITSMHRVRLLHGDVNRERVYNDVKGGSYDIIHFASHSTDEGVEISNGEILSASDIAQIAKIANASLLFFNSCESGKLADYAVSHGILYAIYTNVPLLDDGAWKMPMAFYKSMAEQYESDEDIDYFLAFSNADTREGVYGISLSKDAVYHSPSRLTHVSKTMLALTEGHERMQRHLTLMAFGFLSFVLVTMAMIAYLIVNAR